MKAIILIILWFSVSLPIVAQEHIDRKEMQGITMWLLSQFNKECDGMMVIREFLPHKSNNKIINKLATGRIYFETDEMGQVVDPITHKVSYNYLPKDSIIVDESEYNTMRMMLRDTFFWDQVLPNPDIIINYNTYQYITDSIYNVNTLHKKNNEKETLFYYIAPPIYFKQKMIWYFPKVFKLNGCKTCPPEYFSYFIKKNEKNEWAFYNPD